MKWHCALLQRWLPEYPDGDLPGWGKRWLDAHVAHCAACRQELAELRKVVTAIEAAPAQDPGAQFWSDFSRDMHLKLVQAAPETAPAPSPRRWVRWPYLIGAPALAVLLLWVAVNLTGPGASPPHQAMVIPKMEQGTAKRMSEVVKHAPVASMAPAAAPNGELEQFVPVALGERATPQVDDDVDISGWDLDLELAGMTDQEKEAFLKKMHQRAKDGSCVEKFSLCSWG